MYLTRVFEFLVFSFGILIFIEAQDSTKNVVRDRLNDLVVLARVVNLISDSRPSSTLKPPTSKRKRVNSSSHYDKKNLNGTWIFIGPRESGKAGNETSTTKSPQLGKSFWKSFKASLPTLWDFTLFPFPKNTTTSSVSSNDSLIDKAQNICYTADSRQGRCVNYQQCDWMLKLMQQYTQSNDQYLFNFIWASVCNYANGNPDVCCPSDTSQSPSGVFIFSDINNNPTLAPAAPPSRSIVFVNDPLTGVPLYDSSKDNRCGISNASQTRVIGGQSAQRNAYPWLAALFYGSNDRNLRTLCGGTLITKRHVLTAAHCIKATLRVVSLGEYDISDPSDGVAFNVEWSRQHENYDSRTILNDIGMIKIANDAPISDIIRPICLPLDEPYKSMDYTGYTPIVAGWGSKEVSGQSSNILQEVQVPVISEADCAFNYKLYFPNQVFDERVLCAGSTGKDSCQGDSGGPLALPVMAQDRSYYYFIHIGIVSYGYECGKPGFPGVYTRVSSFLPWILANIN